MFYDFKAKKINGEWVQMDMYRDKVVLIVNTASKCGFTPQLKTLQMLYETYKSQGLEILGFPCNQFANQDPKSNQEISEFCSLNYGTSFTMFEKIDVNGDHAHELYRYLKEVAPGVINNEIKWNFTKFLVDGQGQVIKRYAPTTNPARIEKDIKRLLKEI